MTFPYALWDQLTPTAQGAVSAVVTLLAKRHSGRITLETHEGGVRELQQTTSVRGNELGNQGRPQNSS